MATFQEIASALKGEVLSLKSDFKVSHITCESKKASGALFVAVQGSKVDGHVFIEEALRSGATGVIVSKRIDSLPVPAILVGDTKKALSQTADLIYDYPSKKLFVVGITGTNGKTTTNWIVAHALTSLGLPALRLGTLGVGFPDGKVVSGSLTTPDPMTVHLTLREGIESGAKAAVLEVSSHALDQLRVESVSFDVGIFTNLSHDHLDYHPSMEDYFEAKSKLFTLLETSGKRATACFNLDDPYGERLHNKFHSRMKSLSFGEHEKANVRIVNTNLSIEGSSFSLRYRDREFAISSRMLGAYNVSNLTAAFCACISAGIEPASVANALSSVPDVPGRLERISKNGITAFVDYAHSPDALKRALEALRPFVSGKLWVVFGCGGDRDRAKRPEMGKIASKIADEVVITSDNPRTESPWGIIKDILAGGIVPALTEPDRREAITKTVRSAKPGDVILVAGKGHEDYQILGSEKVHFSDREEISKALASM